MKLTKIEKFIYGSMIGLCILSIGIMVSIRYTNADDDGNCEIQDGIIINGDTRDVYPYPIENTQGSMCADVVGQRTCNDGVIDKGGYNFGYGYGNCVESEGCLFYGEQLDSRDTRTVFAAKFDRSESGGRSCDDLAGTLTCKNGVMVTSWENPDYVNGVYYNGYGYGSCKIGNKCMLDGEATVGHGVEMDVYPTLERPYSSSCDWASKELKCYDGKWYDKDDYPSGDYGGTEVLGYGASTCQKAEPRNCEIEGQIFFEGEAVTGYKQNLYWNEFNTCDSEGNANYLYCNDGKWFYESYYDSEAYGYGYLSCTERDPYNCMLDGEATVPHGTELEGEYYRSEDLNLYGNWSCRDGTWESKGWTYVTSSGLYSDLDGCTWNGNDYPHNNTVNVYTKQTVPLSERCSIKTLKCRDGNWTEGSTVVDISDYFVECTYEPGESCTWNGNSYEHTSSIEVYTGNSAPYGQCSTKELYCYDGKRKTSNYCSLYYPNTYCGWYSSYNANMSSYYSGCQEAAPSACTWNRVTFSHGSGVTVYATESVPYGESCNSQIWTCNNGDWKGSIPYSSSYQSSYPYFNCESSSPNACPYSGEMRPHGSVITAYTKDSEEYQNSCAPKSLTCDNGQWKDENQIVVPYSSCTSTTTCVPGAEAEGRVYDVKDVIVTRNADTNNWDVPVCQWSCDEEKYHREGDVCVVNYKAPSYSGGGGSRTPSTTVNEHNSAEDKQDNKEQIIEKVDNSVVEDTQKSSSEEMKGAVIKVEDKELDMKKYNPRYTPEFNKAYQFAYNNGITTVETIKDAKMYTPIKRIEMAKMLSYFALNILGKIPDDTLYASFRDVSDKMNAQYDNAVTLAYQLGIMGINMPNNRFRPNDNMTRGEFATALSRLVYGTDDGRGKVKYYEPHMAKLYNEGIISEQNPKLKEFRGYVMIMLERIAELEKDSEVEGDENL